MRLTTAIGQRPNGTFGADIAAAGEDLNNPNARKLFTTDAQFVQVIWSETVAFTYDKPQKITTNGPLGPISTYVLTASATYVFPSVLPFKPEIYLTTFITRNGESAYQLASAPSPRNITHEVYNDRVVLGYTETFFDPSDVSALSARVTVLSIPWDRTGSDPVAPSGPGPIPRMEIAEGKFRISKPGFDVTTATGLQLAFSEDLQGLIPGDKGWITGFGDYPLPQNGYVPIIYVVGGAGIAITVNEGKSVFTVSGLSLPAPLRYVIFNNRQF